MVSEQAPVITVDGPSGSGKGTVSQLLAERLGWHFLDSGALYRILGFLAQTRGVSLDDVVGLVDLAGSMDVVFVPGAAGSWQIQVDGRDLGASLRTESCAEAASKVAAIPQVRLALLQKQRDFRRSPGLVADGRDMGTAVFPDAKLKIYLTASPEERAQRRYKQLREKGFDVNLSRLVSEIQARDQRDTGREASPLKPAKEAHILDTTSLSIAEVVDCIYRLFAGEES